MTRPTLAAALAVLALAGCAGQTATQSQATGVYAVEGAYDAAAVAERNYITGTFGTPSAAVVAKMKAADNAAYNLVVQLRTDAQAGKPIAQTAIDAANAAVQQLVSINTAAGAK